VADNFLSLEANLSH